MGNRQRAKQQRVDEREDGGVRADADRQDEHDGERKARLLAQRAYGVSQILLHAAEEVRPLHRSLPFVADGEAFVAHRR